MKSRSPFWLFLTLSGLAVSCTTVDPADRGDPAPAPATATATPAAATAHCTAASGGPAYSKYKTALFGNLHQHTSYSLDAYGLGTRATPAEAYQFAKGQLAIQIAEGYGTGPTVHIDRPLDFLAVTDHSEWLGVTKAIQSCLDPTNQSQDCMVLRATEHAAWTDERQAAADAYEPCTFTSLVAYEWTDMPSDADGNAYMNHRNVIFATDTVPDKPLDSDSYPDTGSLYAGLDQACTGDCAALVIPHNTNLSQGHSLALPATLSASQLTAMTKYQKLVEIYQHKGDSECFSDPNAATDPGCAFEYLTPNAAGDPKTSYVRTALGNGIGYAVAHASANPLQLGVIASTDDHDSTAGYVKEDDFNGHLGITDDTAALRLSGSPDFGPGGLAVVWATQNTRDAVYAALDSRETYATSGPRMTVRFYQTTDTAPCAAPFPNKIIDENAAIAMGGTFHQAGLVGGVAHFAIAAWPDTAKQPVITGPARAAKLGTVEVVKVRTQTVNGATTTSEQVIPVQLSPDGQCVAWSDDQLGSLAATDQALYYVRVRQEKTWRWSHFDCLAQPMTAGCAPGGALNQPIEERAWTSPIWYVP